MAGIDVKRFTTADETRTFGHGKVDLVKVGDTTLGCGRFEPGWRWSTDIKPVAGTKSCEAMHCGYVVSGQMRVRMDDGEETDLKAGDATYIRPGHDAWVVGDEACVMIDFVGFADYAKEQLSTRAAKREEVGAAMH